MRFLSLGIAVLALAEPVPPERLSPSEAAAVTQEILADRGKTEDWLRQAPDSYFAAVGRKDFGRKSSLTVGRSAGNDLRLDGEGIADRHLRITVDGERFRVQSLSPKARFLVKGSTETTAALGPGKISVGRFLLKLSHQNNPAIILFDPRSPRVKDFKGLRYFPVDLAFRYRARLTPDPSEEPRIIRSIRGHKRRAARAGWFEFLVAGKPCRLEADRLLEPGVGEQDLSVLFQDGTTGRETYKLGRYLDPRRQPDGSYILDFNQAYNPACAFSPHYNCPIPPPGNTLAAAIRAGEQDARYH